jgi:2-polyprenyl-3-methyl-5-hydroxy-6-metoxy-1,4-benzoquinol methylase
MAQRTTDQYWSKLYDSGRDFSLVSAAELSKILSFIPEDLPKICLDIGCGTGQLTRELFHRGYSCVGIDASVSATKIAQSLTIASAEQLQYRQFDIEHDDLKTLPQQPYSFIICKLVYAFIEDKPAFLETVQRLLVPGGTFATVTPLVSDTPLERRGIAVTDQQLALVAKTFEPITQYKGLSPDLPLTYLIVRKRAG